MEIIVFGEMMIDKYFFCTTKRKAPEADIPVYTINLTNSKLGGAANVAVTLSNLCKVEFISVVNNNYNINELDELLNGNNMKLTFFKENRKNIIKNIIIYNNNIVSRFDNEDTFDICKNTKDEIYKYIESKINNINGIILSDYNKGIIPKDLCINIIKLCNNNNVNIFIDPKINDINKYKNCTFLKPNYVEALQMLNINEGINPKDLIEQLYKKTECKLLIITHGENGLIGYDNKKVYEIKPSDKINLVDVTGAGDIITAIFTYIYLLTKDFEFALNISNYIAGKSVQHMGNYKFNIEDIKEYFKIIYYNNFHLINYISKIHKNIVFTNGCFDIVHIGHLKLLNFAKSKGDILVLGLNSDESIKKIKGNNRPINNEKDRIDFLLLLNIIDYIIVFDDETPYEIIKSLKPNILIKGGDYKIDEIIGREFVDQVIIYDLVPDKSTTYIINKIKLKGNN